MRKFYILILLSSLCISQGYAQARKNSKRTSNVTSAPKKQGNTFLNKQFWLGFKAGTNLTKAKVEQSYSVLIPPPTALVTEKKYEKFNKFGSQATLEVTFYTRGFSFSLQPTYRHSSFEYTNGYEWLDSDNPNNHLILNYKHQQSTDHAELPFIIKYDIIGNKFRPYVQAGIFYARLINANKSVEISGTDFASGGVNEFTEEPVSVGAEDLFAKNYWGVLAGVGVNYNLGNVRLTFDATYRMGLSLANSTENRYKNDRLSGVGDSLDDIKLDNIVLSFGCLFPMRYLASGFKTLDR